MESSAYNLTGNAVLNDDKDFTEDMDSVMAWKDSEVKAKKIGGNMSEGLSVGMNMDFWKEN